jgi:hypothetical protein
MNKIVGDKLPKLGRPFGAAPPRVAISARVTPELAGRIDKWAEAHSCKRSEAVSQLLAIALKKGRK